MATMPKNLEERVRQILIDCWDPIGCEDSPRNEYDSYGRVICSMIVNSRECTSEKFADYLCKVAKEITGSSLEPKRIHRTAHELVVLRREIQER